MPSRQFRRDPQAAQRQSIEAARAQVRWPALALFILAGFWGSGLLVLTTVRILVTAAAGDVEREPLPIPRESITMIRTAWSVIMILVSIVIALGALQMYQLRSRQWAYCAAIMAMIPCFAPCYIGALPLGIWAIVVLRRPDVDQAFDENARLRINDELRAEPETG
jgi:hypothetical protein